MMSFYSSLSLPLYVLIMAICCIGLVYYIVRIYSKNKNKRYILPTLYISIATGISLIINRIAKEYAPDTWISKVSIFISICCGGVLILSLIIMNIVGYRSGYFNENQKKSMLKGLALLAFAGVLAGIAGLLVFLGVW